jgi:zinc transport system substrate-binding protein
MKKLILATIVTILTLSCSSDDSSSANNTIYVTITPLKSIVEEVTCGDFDVKVLVADGASPETFEPTARQMAELNDAHMIFKVGLIDFERQLTNNIENKNKVVNLGAGITPIAGSCSHHHHHHHHAHGVDPHIWTSPRALKVMVGNVRDAVMRIYPDSTKYDEASIRLMARIDSLDNYCAERIAVADVDAMMIYHPAYTYYAQDYGIEQIAIEHDGKEPSLRQTTALIDKAKEHGVRVILRQPQYSEDKVRAIAKDCGAEIITTDPLSEDIFGEIERVTEIICR